MEEREKLSKISDLALRQRREGRTVYDGLLVQMNKRLSHRFNVVASYAMQKSLVEDPTQNLGNYFSGYGPTPMLPRHNLNVAGTVTLPLGFTLSLNSSVLSRTPQEPLIPGVDILGNGTANGGNTALSIVTPGNQFNCFGYSCGKSDLVKAVTYFNTNWAGKTGGDGNPIPQVVIPPHYQFGDPTFAQDFRITKNFAYKERFKFSILGEFFNAFNIANLTYPNFTLDTLAPGCTLNNGAFASCSGGATQSYSGLVVLHRNYFPASQARQRIPAVPMVALRQRQSMAMADSNQRQEKRSITPSAY